MKTCYYVIVHRPVGSKTWTPYDTDEFGEPIWNFFATKKEAIERINENVAEGFSVYLPGPKKQVGIEFNVGEVVIEHDEPVATSKPK